MGTFSQVTPARPVLEFGGQLWVGDHGDTVVAELPAADATEHSILTAALTTEGAAA